MTAPSDLLIIENNSLNTILLNPDVLAAIPCLKIAEDALRAAGGQKRSCRCRVATNKDGIYRQAKQCIAGLRGEQLQNLKRILNTRQIRIIAPNAQGRMFQFTL